MAIFYNTGMYSAGEQLRKVIKLAPDCFVEYNGAMGSSISTPVNTEQPSSYLASCKSRTAGFKGGLVSISTSASLSPGGGSCTIQLSSPPYDGLHDSYHIKNPDGTQSHYFQPMMEVKVYAKGRFLSQDKATQADGSPSNSPKYHVIFWGFVVGVNAGFSGGNVTYSLSCRDMLHWWDYQTVSIVNSPLNASYNGKPIAPIGTLLRFMNPWEIILNLFKETSFENFIYPTFNAGGQHIPAVEENYIYGENGAINKLKQRANEYWTNRFGSAGVSPVKSATAALSQLEMFGFQEKLDLNKAFIQGPSSSMRSERQAASSEKAKEQAPASEDTDDIVYRLREDMSMTGSLSLDFGMVGKVWPYANMVENMPGTEAVHSSKLEIAGAAIANTHLEFFQDANGLFVMKPPFYNMDTSSSPIYRILSEDIVSINESMDSDGIKNGVQVTGPTITVASVPQQTGFHYDFASIAQYGLRFVAITLPYGNNVEQLRHLAVAEMSMNNAQCTTASLEIPLRPELRVGYPVYIDFMDCFYYITSITHSMNFGSTATTSLSLSAKRQKMWGDNGKPMRAHIYRSIGAALREEAKAQKGYSDSATEAEKASYVQQYLEARVQDVGTAASTAKEDDKTTERPTSFSGGISRYEERSKQEGLYGSQEPGLYKLVVSEAYTAGVTKDTAQAVQSSSTESTRRTLNELVTITEDSVPYTDINGYQHIGGFPYGANLSIGLDYKVKDLSQLGRSGMVDVADIYNIQPGEIVPGPTETEMPESTPSGGSSEAPKENKKEAATVKAAEVDRTYYYSPATHPASAQESTRVAIPVRSSRNGTEEPAFSNLPIFDKTADRPRFNYMPTLTTEILRGNDG